ncbi:MAG TPA: hypothetical protein DIC52_23710 [Candidatus Latescibacteria bacterium]|nr:hypothetical protein [Candidatus Latescibacterota bacterium]
MRSTPKSVCPQSSNCYLAGDGGSRQYLGVNVLQAAGVDVRHLSFQHPWYAQCFPGFEGGMCAFDLLFNCGPRSREVLVVAYRWPRGAPEVGVGHR